MSATATHIALRTEGAKGFPDIADTYCMDELTRYLADSADLELIQRIRAAQSRAIQWALASTATPDVLLSTRVNIWLHDQLPWVMAS